MVDNLVSSEILTFNRDKWAAGYCAVTGNWGFSGDKTPEPYIRIIDSKCKNPETVCKLLGASYREGKRKDRSGSLHIFELRGDAAIKLAKRIDGYAPNR